MQSWRVKSNNTYLSYLLLGLQPSDFGLHTSFRRREIKLGLQTSDFSLPTSDFILRSGEGK